MCLLTTISDQGGFPYGGAEAKYWYLDLSAYEQEDNCIRDDGQIQFVESSPP